MHDPLETHWTPIQALGLPIPIYLVAADGTFLRVNAAARRLFRLPAEGIPDAKITDYYADPVQRTPLVQMADAGGVDGASIVFRITTLRYVLQMFCRPIQISASGERAYLGALIDITHEIEYQELFDGLPAGVYTLDRTDRITRANKTLASLLGYSCIDDLIGTPVSQYYADPDDAARLRVQLRAHGAVVDERVQLRTAGNTTIFASITASNVLDNHGRYAGRRGTIVDVTTEERFRRLLQSMPLGFCAIRQEGTIHKLTECNQQFADLLGFPDRQSAIGTDARELFASEDQAARFIHRLNAAAAAQQPLLGEHVLSRTLSGITKTLEVNSRADFSEGRMIGRTSIVRDVTIEEETRQRLATLSGDIGALLHAYSQTLVQLDLAIQTALSLIEVGGSTRTADLPSAQALWPTVSAARHQLRNSINALLRRDESLQPEPSERLGLRPGLRDELTRLSTQLAAVEAMVEEDEFRLSVAGEAALRVFTAMTRERMRGFPRESLRALSSSAYELARLCALPTLRQARDAIAMSEHQVNAVREYVTAGARASEAREAHELTDLVRAARANLNSYARSRRVDVRLSNGAGRARVFVSRRDVIRALGNLLHNAIKYSWKRQAPDRRWVDVVVEVEGNSGRVVIQNYGVPITKEELASGVIFQLGYRGRHSGDRDRVGTGVGLTDALQVVRWHEGTLHMTSNPASPQGNSEMYTDPFITTATVRLPLETRTRNNQ